MTALEGRPAGSLAIDADRVWRVDSGGAQLPPAVAGLDCHDLRVGVCVRASAVARCHQCCPRGPG